MEFFLIRVSFLHYRENAKIQSKYNFAKKKNNFHKRCGRVLFAKWNVDSQAKLMPNVSYFKTEASCFNCIHPDKFKEK